ncbi:DUF4097 family beta strand repeat-containing protein [Paenibacillus sp. M1]|uniref:DUF4097 family beta strand repeat-containing protein n=1 Tax=Paenibacillus haidiansis TaxID=1574488 RepID=A0ABU7VX07_9BACL
MKLKSRPAALAAAVVAVALLAGCSWVGEKEKDTAGTAADTLEQNIEQNIEQFVEKTVKEAEEAAEKAWDNSEVKLTKADPASLEISASLPVEAASELKVENPVGKIKVEPAAGSDLSVKVKIWSPNKKKYGERLQAIFEQAQISITPSGEELYVSTHAKDDPDLNLWEWAQDQYGFSDFSLEYTIGVPAEIHAFHITSRVGDVVLNGLKGTYRVRSDVGAIELRNASIEGESEISTSTGSVELEIADIESTGSLQVRADTGSIEAELDDSLNCDLETKVELGSISGAPKGKSQIGDGGPLVSLSASLGSIEIK